MIIMFSVLNTPLNDIIIINNTCDRRRTTLFGAVKQRYATLQVLGAVYGMVTVRG